MSASSKDAESLKNSTLLTPHRQADVEVPKEPLDPLDIGAQLDSLRNMEEGWYNGYGKAASHTDLDWLADSFARSYPSGAPSPYLYPTPEGGVQAEWSLGTNEISLEIDFAEHTAEWHCLNLETDLSESRELDLNASGDWVWLADKIQRLGSIAE